VTSPNSRTISRELVHRAAISEVFVTSLTRRRDDQFVTTAQLPRSHAFFGDHTGALENTYDPMMVMEAARQSGMAVVHEHFDVPFTMAFLLRTFNGRAIDGRAWDVEAKPAELTMVTQVTKLTFQQELLAGMAVTVDVKRSGAPMMVVDSKFSWIPKPQWISLRHDIRAKAGLPEAVEAIPHSQPVAASAVGRHLSKNVVISPPKFYGNTAKSLLVVDTGHATLFDHPVDHIPGSLQIEACRQIGVAALRSRFPDATPGLDCVKSTFEAFLELDRPSVIIAEIAEVTDDRAVVSCSIRQFGRPAAQFVAGFLL
jgi:2-oxo-3-(phosphooxy)propyl 3-oxoalkanoate synthase